MKILLTGGTGLIGRHLGRHLESQGHELTVLCRHPETARLPFQTRIFAWDGEKSTPPPESLEGIQAVVHLAGEGIADKRWTPERKQRLKQSRVLSAYRLAEGLEQAGVKPETYIGASGVGIYGDRGDELLTENSKPGHGFLPDLCVEWEAAHHQVPAQSRTILRFGVVLSENGGFLQKVVPLFRTFGASRLGSGSQWLSWIHIQDLMRCFDLAMQHKISGAVNAVAPKPVTNGEMTAFLAEALPTFRAPPVPRFMMKVLYGELGEALLESQKVMPKVLEQQGFQFQVNDFKSALACTKLPAETVIDRFFGSR